MDVRSGLKQRALDIGFDLVGVAPAAPGRDLEFAREWLERGYGGAMHYLSNPKRFDPRAVLPSVTAVICVGLIYDTPFPYSTETGGSRQEGEGSGHDTELRSQKSEFRSRQTLDAICEFPASASNGQRTTDRGQSPVSSFDFPVSNFQCPVSPATESRAWISRYAWGHDYHEVMREKLEKLRAAIEELAPGVETRVYVDTGPVIERAFVRFSGLGWMGKNTCVINEEKGSWFFLGVVLTDLQLDPDLPAPDRCGTCRACLDACPTGAFVEPYVMDAARCISYLTIELKGAIPRELRPGIGVNVFGCDICQDVCPWNSKGRSQESGVRSHEASFEPLTVSMKKLETGNWKLLTGQQSAVSRQLSAGGRASSIQNPPNTPHPIPETFSLVNPPLEALASLTEDDFRKLFAHSPIKRAKYRGWLRNLCVAMGNSGDPSFLPKLQELVQHADPIVREHAQWALEQLRQA
jgi:epoxyqueuosine reductase